MNLPEVISALHGSFTVKIDFVVTPRKRVAWTKTVSGEDFLDGPWEHTYRGIERTHKKAMKKALKATRK